MYKRSYLICLLTFWCAIPLMASMVVPEEQVSISTDKDVYIAGDWVYFSILIHNQNNPVSDFVYVTLNDDHQNQVSTGFLKINSNNASGSFYLADTLSTGIYQLVAFTNNLRNYGPDEYGIKGIMVANRFDTNLKEINEKSVFETADTATHSKPAEIESFLHLNKEVFSQREAVTLDFRLPATIENAMVSVSVRKAAPIRLLEEKTPLSTTPRMTGRQYLPERSGIILQGTVNNKPTKQTVFLSCGDSANLQIAETNSDGEFRFNLKPFYFGKRISIGLQGENSTDIEINTNYYKENNGRLQLSEIVLQGTVNQKPAKKTVFLSCEDSIANLQFTETNSDGEFRFFLNPYYFGKKIAVRLQGEDPAAIQINTKYYTGNIGKPQIQVNGDLEAYLQSDLKYQSIRKSYKENYRQEQTEKQIVKSWRPEVYSRQGELVRPSDYEFLPNFRSISQELLGYYKIRERKNEVVGTLIDINQNEYAIPFIFLDGILLEHVRQIMPLNSKRIEHIVTIPNARFVGNLPIPGILDIHSTRSEIDKVQWRSPVAILNIENPMPVSSYNIPNLGKMPRHMPVFLPLLYWNPAAKINRENAHTFSFYTSDCTGTFEVIVKGFSAEGEELEYRKIFEVQSKK